MDAPRFAAAIQKMAKRKFPDKQFKTFYVVGSDGKKVDGYDFEVLSRDERVQAEYNYQEFKEVFENV